MPEDFILFENLSKTFPEGEHPAVENLSAAIAARQVTGLVGPDGAGKTTLLRLVAGLLLPTSGSIRIPGLGESSGGGSRHEIGYMPQKFGLYEDLSVMENLVLHADLRGVVGQVRKEAFERLLSMTSLAPFTDRLAGKLSGGMKQKLGLGCALLGQPRLLLLDEPGVGVDPISRRELWRMVWQLRDRGLTVIWSTAYLEEAELCDQVLLLNEGKLLFYGPPRELTARVADRSVRIEQLDGPPRRVLAKALRRPEVLDGSIQGKGVRLVLRKAQACPAPSELGAGAGARAVPVKPRFEDAFVDLLGGGPGGESPLAHRDHKTAGACGTVVEAHELTRRFGTFTAADRVTFTVQRGEIFGLLGPNGAGKSTTFRMLCGLLMPTSGTARVMGIDLRKSPTRARQQLGYMAQKFSLYGNLTTAQNLEFFSGVYGLRGKEQRGAVDEMVAAFKLEPMLRVSAETLPLGFKQRLALACALMHEPDILFLDEPTSGVDPVTRREFWTHINGLVEKGVTIVVTTHFMDEAEYCDRIALISRGRVIAAGTPDELKAQATRSDGAEPSMEDAFIHLVEREANGGAE